MRKAPPIDLLAAFFLFPGSIAAQAPVRISEKREGKSEKNPGEEEGAL